MGLVDKIKKYKYLIWFLLSFIFLFGFLSLFEDVILEKSIPSLDYIIVNWVYSFRTPVLNEIMKAITTLGNVSGVAIFLGIVLIALFFLKKKKYIIPIIISSVFGEVFVYFMKIIAQRARPLTQNALITETDFSFPSGHAMIAITVYGFVLYFLIQACKERWQRIALVIVGGLLILSIGFSRLYLGVHWPTDILASYLLGGSWVCFLIGGIEGKEDIKRLIKR